jgi:FHS family L-fucose permease-like MFS transporter
VAIVGGAIIPLVQGMIADNVGLQMALFLPVSCYFYIGFYGLRYSKIVNMQFK